MKTVVIFTVGGSPQPIINAIKEIDPDFIYFICSGGPEDKATERFVDGRPLKKEDKIIVKEINLPKDKYEKIIIPLEILDSLDMVFSLVEKELLHRIKSKFGNVENLRIIANYTGGTKSMSIALALLAILQDGWELHFNAGQRTNVIKIDRGDHPVAINKINLLLKLDVNFWQSLMEKFYYEHILEKLKAYLVSPSLLPELKMRLITLKNLLLAFTLWDTFNHEEALSMMETAKTNLNGQKVINYYLTLKRILGIMRATGYEKVLDLIRNAERRAVQRRFDDAVARLYRALEMLAQIRLKQKYNIDPSKITEDTLINLPPKAKEFLTQEFERNKDESGVLKIALTKCFELLNALEDPAGKFYAEVKSKFLDVIKKRNLSILAHGTDPISENEYQDVYNFVKDFIYTILFKKFSLKLEDIPQFPKNFKELDFSLE
ncbi:MAG: TIGR02710 family CRISPR-associated protein [Thermodesulfobacteria bacterium]|nr:TIGR02710 family CRISPR-associated protein [Thermodesulfobacteriota bacterium]